MTPLASLLTRFRTSSHTGREKGNYFEELVLNYFRHEATYADLYEKVWQYADWAHEQGLDARDTGIDLVARTAGTGEYHAIQCKFYAPDHAIRKQDIDSFFTASGQKPFTHRIIVASTNRWTENAEHALVGQQPAVTKIDLHDLENSRIDWSRYEPSKPPPLKPRKTLRRHQIHARDAVLRGLATANRGKLIMACGTGKTFTSLKIAEDLTGPGKRVLFLVPSLSLLSQTLTEWTQEAATPLHCFAVCSDAEVGKKRKREEDSVQTFAHELRYPATTDARRLAMEMAKRHDAGHLSVVFSTYHSLQVLSEAQHLHGLPAFDLVICDEAHRTTGATYANEEESNFVRVHDSRFLLADKRLYMTATPRIYADMAKAVAEQQNATVCSMDDPALFGEQLHIITFSEAVELGLLVDYKVIVLTIDEAHVSTRLQNLLKDDNNALKVDDAARIIGCWKALSKHGVRDRIEGSGSPMRRAVAFCQVIERQSEKARIHKVSSKEIASMFQAVVEAYNEKETEVENPLVCEAAHIDGTMNATAKEEKLDWLKEAPPANTCRILSNVRCLSEGVDVPSLDAVLFLSPRSSPVEVVQSVGRVMRNAPGKERGYVILPVVIPAGMDPAEALNDNKVYKVVWEVLQALRSHDDRFDAMINKLDLIGRDPRKMEVVAITDKLPAKSAALTAKQKRAKESGKNQYAISETGDALIEEPQQTHLHFNVGELERALYARVVKKCGNRNYWDEWAADIAKIANTHIARITTIVNDDTHPAAQEAFRRFANELRDDLNDAITDAEVIEMLAQHLITKPVFDALFADYSFASNNPVSLAMQQVLDTLQEHRLDKEADTLEKFYASVRRRADGIDNAAGKQKIVVELYDKFFRNAFPRMTERLGIVYTPVEVVDFIIHSVNDLLQQEFGQSLGSEGVHILDPFTGTGTFITRLLQSGLITPEQLPHKYQNEIHANEIVLLAYYIAAINIEAVYHALMGNGKMGDGGTLHPKTPYTPFPGICLTDTFQLYEEGDLLNRIFFKNADRRKRQKELDIRVIIGNPPYSAGQESANDNNQNIAYPHLDERIRKTYAAHSSATLKNALYDSYIRAIRWASDRIGDAGIIGYVTNAGFLEANTADGLRKCLAEEFSSIHVFHLRGNQRTSGELSRKEGGKIFGSGSRAPIAISLLVKNPKAIKHGQIFWHDIGDYLTREQKLEGVSTFKSLNGITAVNGWTHITPDAHHDWVNQRDHSFDRFIKIGDKRNRDIPQLFQDYSGGMKSGRDAWCCNMSKSMVEANMRRMIDFYNDQVNKYRLLSPKSSVDDFIDTDPSMISWNRALKSDLSNDRIHEFSETCIVISSYRPFTKLWSYFSGTMNDLVSLMPKVFPTKQKTNVAIAISGVGSRYFTSFAINALPGYDMVEKGQCFPLYLYEKTDPTDGDDLFSLAERDTAPSTNESGVPGYRRRDAISDAGLAHFQEAYPKPGEGDRITKEDLFYYIYGLLHSPDYRSRYADNLSKELPRIPAVKDFVDFRAFSAAGRALAGLHLNYETATPYPASVEISGKTYPADKLPALKADDYRVVKMKFPKVKDPETGKSIPDKTTVHYNPKITVKNLPPEAYRYIVNGKSAIEWVMERQAVTTDKASGITNDANRYALETMNNSRYPLELLLRVTTVSLETMKIVDGLPGLEVG